ncbi:MAG: GAF domain-containing sensor histidine kinase [Nitrospinae bacterium]|nr:GAF domain-containing sensor histidine kinase [Nitrospinota bacterium]
MSTRSRAQQLSQRLGRLEQELEAAGRVSQALSQHIKVDELVETALRTALEVVGAEAGSVLLAQPETKKLIFRHVIGEAAELLRGTAIPMDQGLAGAVFTSGEPQVTGDAAQDSRHLASIDGFTGFKTRDMITLPLKRWEGEPIGVLQVLNKRMGRLDEDDVSILTIISALTAAAIEQARLFEEAKLGEVVRLLGDISHDIRNLFTPVFAAARLLEGELDHFFGSLPEIDASKAQASHELCGAVIGMLRKAALRMQDRVKEITDCVQGLSAPPHFAPCEITGVVDSVVQTLHLLAEEKGISLRSEGLDALPPILADERRLYNAFYNLVNNAIPEVPVGGCITISGRAEPKSGVILLSVVDTGRGMPAAVRDSLFTARAISRKAGGTGLGTKIVKDVVDAHGGQITVDSEEGVGTTFLVRLPLHPPGSLAARAGG